ncbi:MAG: exodeoxyribonuclease III [Verrucomicrobiales bacterium]|nr:exodeoxyribonuclease III [Verrucomicrobiales bacterium]
MKLISWNVNGIRAALGKGFRDFFEDQGADILCLQETKAREEQVDMDWMHDYTAYWNSAEKAGYSGTAIFTKTEPLNVQFGMGIEAHDTEGRVITLQFKDFFLVTVYTPNSQNQLKRLPYRKRWDRDFLTYLKSLEKTLPVIFCGDLNVAHEEIDLARPDANHQSPGFSDEERAGFSKLLEEGFVDTFREFEKGGEHYSWWSYRAGARARNVGWRLDYWCISASLRPRLKNSRILPEVMGSDHCPVIMELD